MPARKISIKIDGGPPQRATLITKPDAAAPQNEFMQDAFVRALDVAEWLGVPGTAVRDIVDSHLVTGYYFGGHGKDGRHRAVSLRLRNADVANWPANVVITGDGTAYLVEPDISAAHEGTAALLT